MVLRFEINMLTFAILCLILFGDQTNRSRHYGAPIYVDLQDMT